jgi:hypothetical protein
MLWQACGDKSSHFMFMLKVEYNLNPNLAPWGELALFQSSTDLRHPPSFQLRDRFSGECWIDVDHTSNAPAAAWAEWDLTGRIFSHVESVRDSILKGQPLEDEYLEFAFCFREFLESSDKEMLPHVTHGTSKIRQLTTPEVRRARIPFPGCVCSQLDQNTPHTSPLCSCPWSALETQTITDNQLRRSQDPEYVQERDLIRDFFLRMEADHNTDELAGWRRPSRATREGILHLIGPEVKPEFAHLVREI